MNLAILHAGALGDCVLTLHVAMALRAAGHRMTVAARSPIAAWAARRGLIDETIALEKLAPVLWGSGPAPVLDGDGNASLAHMDCIISFLGGADEPLHQRLAYFFGADRIISIDPKPTQETLRKGSHITQQWACELRRANFDRELNISDAKYEISNLGSDDSGKLPHYQTTTLPNLIVHPGSGGRDKCCPIVALEALMQRRKAKGWNAQWMIGPDEAERDGAEFRGRLEKTAPVIFEESIEKASDIVTAGDAYIGNDAGMTHVAALASVNTVALFGPTDPYIWRPLGPRCTVFPFPTGNSDQQWTESMVRILDQNG